MENQAAGPRLSQRPDVKTKAMLILYPCPGTKLERSGLVVGLEGVKALLCGLQETRVISPQTTVCSFGNAVETSSVSFVQHCLNSFPLYDGVLLTLSHLTPTNCIENAVLPNKLA